MRVPPLTRTVLLGILLAALGTRAAPAFAASFSSSNFTSSDALIGTFGGLSTSTSFSSVSAGGQPATGISTSTNFEVRSGSLYYDTFSPESQNWRWYSDVTDETPISPLASENVAPSNVADGSSLKLRWTMHETAGIGDSGVKFRLQFATSSDFSNPSYVVEQGSCTGSSAWCYASGAGADNALITTGVLSDSDSCTAGVGTGCGTHNTSGTSISTSTQSANAATEYEFTIQSSGAYPSTVYFFRAVLVSASTTVPLATGAVYPSLSTAGGTLSFTIDGLPAATSTSGVTTSVDTSSTGVPFGALPFASSTVAANRLVVSTDASAGYQIVAYERQQLINTSGFAIPPVLGTNTSPLAWATGCASTATGCWGYHTSASVLGGGSTRFAPNDTYAQFTSSPAQVAYSATPVTSQSTDMVYRLAVDREQESGDYSTELVYIVTPVF